MYGYGRVFNFVHKILVTILSPFTFYRVAILGDTSYGECCVDEVAAAHLGADSVIHFKFNDEILPLITSKFFIAMIPGKISSIFD